MHLKWQAKNIEIENSVYENANFQFTVVLEESTKHSSLVEMNNAWQVILPQGNNAK